MIIRIIDWAVHRARRLRRDDVTEARHEGAQVTGPAS